MAIKKLTPEEIDRRVFESSGGIVTLDKNTYTNTATKARFIDKDFGEWWSTPRNIYARFNGHPQRALFELSVPKISIEEINARVFNAHGDTVKMDASTYTGTNKKCTFVDRDYGEWQATPLNVCNGYGHKERGRIKQSETSRYSADEVQEKLNTLYGDMVVLKKDTYLNAHSIATFIDKDFGEWVSVVSSVLRGHLSSKRGSHRRQQTNIQRYGVPFTMQRNDIALKQQKSHLKHTRKIHWKTGEELVCQASYEPKVVDYLNFNKIDYLWQPQTFKIPNGKTYRPDMFLIDRNVWVEIKGFMRPHSQLKWDWFLTQFSDAELWDKKKLKEMGIL